MKITGIGEVQIQTKNKGTSIDITLNNAMLVPDLHTNLLSVSKITDPGSTVTLDKKGR